MTYRDAITWLYGTQWHGIKLGLENMRRLATALGLWGLQSWARVVAMIVAGISLFEAVLAFFQFPGSGVGFAMGLLPLVILWYLNSREVKAAFGEEV